MHDSSYTVIVDEHNFPTEVLDRSEKVPVLVDFWAEWCAPCKMLLPVLEQLVQKNQGNFILAKVNTDEQRELAAQYNIRSIPSLKLFRHRQVVEEVTGVQPETVLQTLIDRYRERPVEKIRMQALQAHALGDNEKACALLEQACAEDPDYHVLHLDMANIFMAMQAFAQAEQQLKALPANLQADPEVNKLTIKIDFAKIAAKAPDTNALEEQVATTVDNHLARYQLAVKKALAGDFETAMAHLLELMRRARHFQEDAPRKGLLAIFALLDNQGDLVNRYRSKMSSLLY
jgi:putative thioredoxin